MRIILIALVLLMTVLTFYSALWFKSESIEDDITRRVTDELDTSGATGIDVGVDGRHVTLSGIVYDETTEAAYLDTADRTYGALGPIDGLTYLADGGYISATKTPEGITLRGIVPSEDDRVELVAKAAAATDGTVDDQLEIGGVDAAWQDEADFGLAQIATLKTGALKITPDAYVLSGTTDGDVIEATADLDGRAGWTTFVSSPAVENALRAEVGRLNGVVAERDSTIAGLAVDRDGLSNQLDGLRSNLTADQAALQGELDVARAVIADRDETIENQQGVIDNRLSTIARQGTMIRDRDTTITELNGRIDDLETELEQRQDALGSTDEQVAALQGEVDAQAGTIADLEGNIGDLNGRVAERDETIAGLETNVSRLTGLVAERDDTIAGLQSDLETERANAAASDNDRIVALTGQVADRDSTIAELNGTVADLRGQVSDGEGSLTATAAQIAALTAAKQDNEARTSALQGQVDNLTGIVAERDATIEALRAAPTSATVASSAEQCAAQAANVMEDSRINFVTNSAQIEDGSVALLERMTGIALACVDEGGLTVEVGGHTDSDGSEENNQSLSEARAQAVVDFMTARGVPTGGLNAVGYGESQPIADNATAEGKAQNRRISFDWQTR